MTLATKHVSQKWSEKYTSTDVPDNTFSVMYTPMNTGDYRIYPYDSMSLFSTFMFEIFTVGMATILKAIREPREDTIELIMKRMGVQKSVI